MGPLVAWMPPVPAYLAVVPSSVSNESMIELAPLALGSVFVVSDVEVVLPVPVPQVGHETVTAPVDGPAPPFTSIGEVAATLDTPPALPLAAAVTTPCWFTVIFALV